MKNDELELYDIAIGGIYSSTETASTSNAATRSEIRSAPSVSLPDDTSVPMAIFRNLLMGSRSQIEKLKAENKHLETNLKNAIASAGVVICPNCTHHFKDRQCSMRPRSMRKMRARNCLEIEFETLDDMETWLYLNQLETNNDGMPTVMNAKKAKNSTVSSLESVGSTLPVLVEEGKEKREIRREIIKLKNKENGNNPFCKSNGNFSKLSDKTDWAKTGKNNSKNHKKQETAQNDKIKLITNARLIDSHGSEFRKEPDSRRRSAQDNGKEKKSDCKGRNDITIRPTEPPKKDSSKRKISRTNEHIPEAKIAKKDISDRVEFPQAKIQSSNTEVLPSSSSLHLKEDSSHIVATSTDCITPSQTEKKLKRAPILWDDSFEKSRQAKKIEKNYSETNSKKPLEFKIKPIKKVKEVANKDVPQKAIIPTQSEKPKPKYKFVPTSKKKDVENVNFIEPIRAAVPVAAPAIAPIIKPTTALKTAPASNSNIVPIISGNNSQESNRFISQSIPMGARSSTESTSVPIAEVKWELLTVTKNGAVLDHIYKRALERQKFGRNWPIATIPNKDPDHPDTSGLTTDQRNIAERLPEETSKFSTTSEKKVMDPMMISDSLKLIGISEEGIALLKKQLESNANSSEKIQELDKTISKVQCSAINRIDASGPEKLLENVSIAVNEHNPAPIPNNSSRILDSKTSNPNKNDDDENDALGEFFPDLAYKTNQQVAEGTPTNTESSCRPISTQSFGSMVDREEEELALLIREDSAAPPGGDCLLSMDLVDYDQTIILQEEAENVVQQLEEDPNVKNDWSEFCLEDVEDDVDETTRDRKLSEMERSESIGTVMEWNGDGEELDEDFDVESQMQNIADSESIGESLIVDGGENEGEESEAIRTESVPLDMNSDFRLSDEEDLISPMTSTPRQEEVENDNKEEEGVFPAIKDDSFVDELDWNYGTDVDGEDDISDEGEGNTTVNEITNVRGTCDADNIVQNDPLEDGEISEDEEKEKKKEKEEAVTKKPIRERIQFPVEGDKTVTEDHNNKEDDHRRPDYEKKYNSSHRGSQENRDRNYKRDHRPSSYKSLLKRRNS